MRACSFIAAAIGLALTTSAAHAERTPPPGMQDSRVRVVSYNADEVYRIRGVFRTASQIVFASGETIASVALGDTVSWEVAPAENVLFIKPREQAGPTNLLVITKREGITRSYSFALSARSGSIGPGSDAVFVVRFRYPGEEAAAARAYQLAELQGRALGIEAGAVRLALDAAAVQGSRNLDYSVAGSSDLEPSEVTDNGQFTILRFPRGQAVPAIFTVAPDGSEAVVPYDVRGEFVVIHQVSREFRLRRGRTLTCIWNNRYDRYGPDTQSGTASSEVIRQIEGRH